MTLKELVDLHGLGCHVRKMTWGAGKYFIPLEIENSNYDVVYKGVQYLKGVADDRRWSWGNKEGYYMDWQLCKSKSWDLLTEVSRLNLVDEILEVSYEEFEKESKRG